MKKRPSARALVLALRERGPAWGVRRVREELLTPTYQLSERAGRYVEGTRRLVRQTRPRATSGGHGADLTAVFELTAGAVGFDFAYFLVFAEAYARSLGKRTIFVILLRAPEGAIPPSRADVGFDEAELEWRIANIVSPMVEMHEVSIGYAVLPKNISIDNYVNGTAVYPPRFSDTYHPRFSYRESLPTLRADQFSGFRAPTQARRYVDNWRETAGVVRPMVVLTLRQRRYDPARNSNIPEWVEFARWLQKQGFEPVFVPDTEASWDLRTDLEGFNVFGEAPWNLAMRLALYECAFVNMFFSNGPAAMAQLDKKTRYIAFNPPNEDSLHASSEALARIATPTGESQFAFAGAGQRLSWKVDSRENLQHEFSEYVDRFGDGSVVP